MPIVRIEMFEGRSLEKKRRLVAEIADLVAEVCEVSRDGVHVLIDEKSRDNWGRGGILHRDRTVPGEAASSFARNDFRTVSWVQVAPGRVEEYLAYRKDEVNPAMAEMDGFQGSVIVRDLKDDHRFLLFNYWRKEAEWRAYQATPVHDKLKATIRGDLTASMKLGRYQNTELIHAAGADLPTGKPLYLTVSTHRVKTGQDEVYKSLRNTSVHPSMAEFPGFIASNALESLEEPFAYLIVNVWESKTAANAYATSQAHYTLRDQVRALLSEHSGTREYELVTL
jgi:4-oxalocrotonate tautomerase